MITDDRGVMIHQLVPGDIFHAGCPGGASLICLVTDIGPSSVEARTVTTQHCYSFNRATGVAKSADTLCVIDSVTPLPVDIHNVVLGIDRKFRLAHTMEGLKLNEAEIQALVFIDSFYARNRLPEKSAP